MTKRFIIVGLTIILGAVLTLASVLKLCSVECVEGHKYQLFGQKFEYFGFLFFFTVAVVHLLSRTRPALDYLVLLLFSSAIGAEIWFIAIQKTQIGHWCPVCLGIASCIFIGGGTQMWYVLQQIKENNMKKLSRIVSSGIVACIGFFAAFLGIAKFDPIQAAQESIQENIPFGDKDSKIEVYLFTDWACPACQKLELTIDGIVSEATKKSQFIFVDHVVHPETLNFIPYNLSFIVNDKPQYLKLRHMLTEISKETGSPTEEQIIEGAKKYGVNYKQLDYADVAFGIKYFKKLGETFQIKGTPTMVIVNRDTKKGKKLQGNGEITMQNINEAIDNLSKI